MCPVLLRYVGDGLTQKFCFKPDENEQIFEIVSLRFYFRYNIQQRFQI